MNLDATKLVLEKEDVLRWNNLMLKAKPTSYIHSFPYAYRRVSEKYFTESFIYSNDIEDIAGVHYSILKSAMNLVTVSDLKAGLVNRQYNEPEIYNEILKDYLNWVNRNNVSFARINTWLPRFISGKEISSSKEIEDVIFDYGFKPVSAPRHTYWIDLLQSEDEMLAKMHRQTRSRIRQGLKSEIETVVCDYLNTELIDLFWEQYSELSVNKGFNSYSEKAFKDDLTSLISAGLGLLFIQKYNDTIINFSFMSNYNTATYMHGAVNKEFKKLQGCPSPGQLAQWMMIMKAKELGAKMYDLGFCPGPVPIPEHPRYPVWSFKHGFGGESIEFLPEYGKIIKPIRGRIFHFIRYKKLA